MEKVCSLLFFFHLVSTKFLSVRILILIQFVFSNYSFSLLLYPVLLWSNYVSIDLHFVEMIAQEIHKFEIIAQEIHKFEMIA